MTTKILTLGIARFTDYSWVYLGTVMRSLKIFSKWSFGVFTTFLWVFALLKDLISIDKFILYLTGSKTCSFKEESFKTFFEDRIELQTESGFVSLWVGDIGVMMIDMLRFFFIEKSIDKISELFLSIYFIVIKRLSSYCINSYFILFVASEEILSRRIKFWRICNRFYSFALKTTELCFFQRILSISMFFLFNYKH